MEKQIIDFIIKNPDVFLNSTAKELALLTYSSAPTIIRLTKKLGFASYQEFKIKYASSVNVNTPTSSSYLDQNFPFDSKDNLNAIIKKIAQLQMDSVEEAVLHINEELYTKSIDLLHAANVIDVYGAEININLAYDFSYKLSRIDRKVELTSSKENQLFIAAKSNNSHCALFISYSGLSESLCVCAKVLKDNNVPIICITGSNNNPLSKLSDIVLQIPSKEELHSKIGTFSSKYSIMFILDVLFSGIFARDYQKNILCTEKISKVLSSKKT